jgi:serine/threonine protein kinase/Tol biopolymer transport system component
MADTPHFCDHCGAANRGTARFCTVCGQSLQLDAPLSANDTLSPSQILKQRYQILSTIGQGGFGTIYKAEDLTFHHAVRAIKEMRVQHLTLQEKQEAIDAFQHEASLLAGLTHPHLPRIYDHFEDHSHWYLVMDFIEGETLEKRLGDATGNKLPVQQVLPFALQLCNVLNYLHSRQPPIIFRDLKPANVMITHDDHLYLIDFGIARLFKAGQAKDTVALGSPGYAAPEQYGKAQTTERTDIYSLGATLHHLLSGRDPGEDPFQFPPLDLDQYPHINQPLARLIQSMVDMKRENRPDNVQVVKQELLRLSQLPLTTSPTQPPSGNDLQKQLNSKPEELNQNEMEALLALSTTPINIKRGDVVEGVIVRIDQDEILVDIGLQSEGVLSTRELPASGYGSFSELHLNDQVLVYVIQPQTSAGHAVLSLKRASTERQWRIAEEQYKNGELLKAKVIDFNKGGVVVDIHGIRGFVPFSKLPSVKGRDTSTLERMRNKELQLAIIEVNRSRNQLILAEQSANLGTKKAKPNQSAYTIVSSPTRPVQSQKAPSNTPSTAPMVGTNLCTCRNESSDFYALAWSPDGHSLASGGFDGIRIWNATTGEQIVDTYKAVAGCSIAWSPNGKQIVAGYESITIVDTTTFQRILRYNSGAIDSVAWSPDGRWIVSSGYVSKVAQTWNTFSQESLLTYRKHSAGVVAIAWSPNSRYVASGGNDRTVQVWDAASGETLYSHLGHSGYVRAVAWSPDGKRIASASWDNTVQVWNVFTNYHTYTYRGHSNYVNGLSWSPNGKYIASGGYDKTVQVWNATTGQVIFTYTGHTNRVKVVAWSPDGNRIASLCDMTIQVWQAPQ